MSVQNTNLTSTNPGNGDAGIQGANRSRRSQEAHSTKETQKVASSATGTAVARAPSGDDVQLSGLAKHLQTLKTALSTDSPQHQAKVEALTKAYAEGSYKADAHATASGIVDDAIHNHGGQ